MTAETAWEICPELELGFLNAGLHLRHVGLSENKANTNWRTLQKHSVMKPTITIERTIETKNVIQLSLWDQAGARIVNDAFAFGYGYFAAARSISKFSIIFISDVDSCGPENFAIKSNRSIRSSILSLRMSHF